MTSARARGWALVLMVASGFAGLGYQIVWTQQSALWLGQETAAILAVVAAFFGGLAVGALALGRRIDRSEHPTRWYAVCEALIAVWCGALVVLMDPAAQLLLDLIGDQPAPTWHWTVAFGGTFFLLLPATAAMGATLPAMERILGALRRGGHSIAVLYASNTFGAVLGSLAAAFVLAPRIGFTRTALLCGALNMVCALAALAVFPKSVLPAVPARPKGTDAHLITLIATGFLGIGYEVLVVRVLSQVAENTIYTFALLLAVYLIGTAIGAAGYARSRSTSAAATLRNRLLRAQAVACLLGLVALALSHQIKRVLLDLLGATMTGALAAEAALALIAFLGPTIVMGALFAHLMTTARADGIDIGRALGVNTLGAACAPILFGVIATTTIGPAAALVCVALGYLALTTTPAWRDKTQWASVAAALAALFWVPTLAFVAVPSGARLVTHIEGAGGSVSVIETDTGVKTLHINNRQQEGSNATLVADARQGLLPVLLHPAPQRALFLGLGTGVTARSAATHANLRVDAVELLPEVIEASRHFDTNVDGQSERLRIISADSRRFVRTAAARYDVIVADNFHPARSGSGALYTTEHFAAVRERLAPNGLFCQWLPLHQLDMATLRIIVGSFMHEFPHASAVLATNSLDTPVIGLLGSRDEVRFAMSAIPGRIASAHLPKTVNHLGLEDELALLGSLIADRTSLARFAQGAPLNTDDRPVVIYRAPRVTYAPENSPRDRLLALLDELAISPHEVLTAGPTFDEQRRLSAYWDARNRYLVAGHRVKPTTDVRRMLSQVRQPLLNVLQISPDFRPAYLPLVQMAAALGRTDPSEARRLLIEIDTVAPTWPEAKQVLRELDR